MVTTILFAGAGGLAFGVFHFLEHWKIPKNERPDFKDPLFWGQYIAWPFLGILLALAYANSGNTLSAILALNVGISAPLIFRQVMSSNPFQKTSIDPGEGA